MWDLPTIIGVNFDLPALFPPHKVREILPCIMLQVERNVLTVAGAILTFNEEFLPAYLQWPPEHIHSLATKKIFYYTWNNDKEVRLNDCRDRHRLQKGSDD